MIEMVGPTKSECSLWTLGVADTAQDNVPDLKASRLVWWVEGKASKEGLQQF